MTLEMTALISSQNDLSSKSDIENKQSFACEHKDCNEKFSTSHNLIQHVKTVHEKKKTSNCDECNAEFARSSHLEMHIISVHKGKKPYQKM